MGSAPVECMDQMTFECVDHSNSTQPENRGRHTDFSRPLTTLGVAREIGVPSPGFPSGHTIETQPCDSDWLSLRRKTGAPIALSFVIPLFAHPLIAQDLPIPQDFATVQDVAIVQDVVINQDAAVTQSATPPQAPNPPASANPLPNTNPPSSDTQAPE